TRTDNVTDEAMVDMGYHTLITPPCVHDGDVNGSGDITSADGQQAFIIMLGAGSPTYEEMCAADCNGDGLVTSGDAQLIFMAAMGVEDCADPLR
ncbi:MAG TPA: dockerin type I repeat-containing protein, partial [bacterium]|nr:dockerin type I repeat-containing protein [bacterium]